MYSASSLLRKDYKVLVTTTTHIYIPDKSIYDEIIMLNDFPNENYHSILQNNKNGVYVIGNHIVNNLKIKGLTFDMLDEIIHYFDIENINNKTNALNLIKNIKCKSSSYINRYIYGSIFTNEYIKG